MARKLRPAGVLRIVATTGLAIAPVAVTAPADIVTFERPDATGVPWIWRATGSGADKTALTKGRSPVISPDGRFVAFLRPTTAGGADLAILPTSGGGDHTLHPAGADGDPVEVVWSRDARRLAVLEPRRIVVVDRIGGGRRTLASSDGRGSLTSPTFAPDGRTLAYARITPGGVDIEVVPVAGGTARQITQDRRSFAPVWGARGIVYSRGVLGDVWTMRGDGGGAAQVTRTRSGLVPVAVSADGTRIVAHNPPANDGRVWAITLPNGRARPLTGWVTNLSALDISRDGSTVLAAVGCPTVGEASVALVQAIPFAGGPRRILAKETCRASWSR